MCGVQVRARDWGWRHAGRDRWALRGVEVTVEPGERVLLTGASGAGKSTLLHALAGLTGEGSALTGDEQGELLVAGRHAREVRDRVALVAQDPQTQLVMARAGDDVAFGLENRAVPREEIWPRVHTALAQVGFPYELDRRTEALSGGEQQRLVIAGALAARPGLLLLDEPTANLDGDGARAVRSLLARLAADGDATMILVEHRVAEVVELVDRVLVVEAGGGIIADGPPATVFAAHGEELAKGGVWVPGHEPVARAGPPRPGRDTVSMHDCGMRAPSVGLAGDWVFTGVDATLTEGTSTAITGPNGAGKSTLLMLAAGLGRPDAGEVRPAGPLAAVDGRPLHRWPARVLADHVGAVFQHADDQFVAATVRAELGFGLARAGIRNAETTRRVDELLARLRLTDVADAHPFTLSGGEKRRLSVATALASAPSVLALDEPTFGQDAATWAELVELLVRLRDDGRALAIATHDRRLLDTLADRVLELTPPAERDAVRAAAP